MKTDWDYVVQQLEDSTWIGCTYPQWLDGRSGGVQFIKLHKKVKVNEGAIAMIELSEGKNVPGVGYKRAYSYNDTTGKIQYHVMKSQVVYSV